MIAPDCESRASQRQLGAGPGRSVGTTSGCHEVAAAPTPAALASYQVSTRSARSVFQRLGCPSPSSMRSAPHRDGCSRAATCRRAAAWSAAARSPRPVADPAGPRRRGSSPGRAARRSATRSGTRTAASPGRPPRRCSGAGTAGARAGTPRLGGAPRAPAPNRQSPARARATPRARRSSSRTTSAPSRSRPRSSSRRPRAARRAVGRRCHRRPLRSTAPIATVRPLMQGSTSPSKNGCPACSHRQFSRTSAIGFADRLRRPGRRRSRAAASGSATSRSTADPGRSRRGSPPGSTRRPPTGRPRRASEQSGAPPLGRDARPLRGHRLGGRVAQVAQDLPAQRRVRVQQPVHDVHASTVGQSARGHRTKSFWNPWYSTNLLSAPSARSWDVAARVCER